MKSYDMLGRILNVLRHPATSQHPRKFYRIAKKDYLWIDPKKSDETRPYPAARWNKQGQRAIYAAEHFALALLEKLVHANGSMPKDQYYITVAVPPDIAIDERLSQGCEGWDSLENHTPSQHHAQSWFAAGESAVLVVPSIVTYIGRASLGRNVVINPAHPDFSKLEPRVPVEVTWDPRLKGLFDSKSSH